MARCNCRWRNVFICLCSPCICLVLLFIFVGVMVCMSIAGTGPPGTLLWGIDPNNAHFIAPGTDTNGIFAPFPKSFWNLRERALWNHHQLDLDLQFNPILRPNNTEVGFDQKTKPLIQQSPLEVPDLENRRNYDELPQLMQDFVSSMHRRDYPTLIQPKGICGAGAKDEKEPPLLLLAIKSTELNLKNRHAIRKTWGQTGWVAAQRNKSGEGVGGYVRRVFLLGKESPEELGVTNSALLQLESQLYGDILQWDFKDTFFNLTLKDVLFWEWFSCSCSETRFVFKGDDDVFVNTKRMIGYLQEQLETPRAHETLKDFMVGNVIVGAVPIRVNSSKYFIPESFYRGLYPMYAGGGGVVYSGLLTLRLLEISKRVHMYPIDDVYVGMCMIRLNLSPLDHPAFLSFDFPKKEGKKVCSYHTILLVHRRSPRQIVKLWVDLKRTKTECWDVPLRGGDKMAATTLI